MTEISESAKVRWGELIKRSDYKPGHASLLLIQQMSDVAKKLLDDTSWSAFDILVLKRALDPFILPESGDPLAEALRETQGWPFDKRAEMIRDELAKRGFQITEIHNER